MNLRLIAFAVGIAGLPGSARAQDTSTTAPAESELTKEEATRIIRETVDRAVEVLENPELQGADNRRERHRRLRSISNEVFDWEQMAQRSLGVHWRELNPKQRERFVSTFKELLANHYLGQMDRFQGDEEVKHVGTESTKKGFVVKMKLITPSRSWVPIDFYLGAERRVYDVAIEGVSLSNHYRGSFDRLLVNATFEEMMKRLERKLDVQRRMAEQGGSDDEGAERDG